MTLSSFEAKRLVAMGISKLGVLKNAVKKGIVTICHSSTGAYIYEEITGDKMPDKGNFICGGIYPFGTCWSNPEQLDPPILIKRGKRVELQQGDDNVILTPFVKEMTEKDVFIKSGNLIDPSGKVGVFVGDPNEKLRSIISLIQSRNVNLLVPMTSNKRIPISIEQAMKACNEDAEQIHQRSMGMVVKVLHLPGEVFTEIDAFKILTGASVIPIAMNSVQGDSAVTYILDGSEHDVEKAWWLTLKLKGEPPIEVRKLHCARCTQECAFAGTPVRHLPKWIAHYECMHESGVR